MFCKGCCYDLSGVTPEAESLHPGAPIAPVCPECGRGFVREDPRTWQRVPRGRAMQLLMGPVGALGVAALVAVSCLWLTLIPRPDALDLSLPRVMRSWSMWTWLGDRYGVDRVLVEGRPIEITYSAGAITRVRGDAAKGAGSWDVQSLGDGVARVRVDEPGENSGDVLRGVRMVQGWPGELRFGPVPPARRGGPGEYVGEWPELAARLAEHFSLGVVPIVADRDDDSVWWLHPGDDRVTRVSLVRLRAWGIDPLLVTTSGPRGVSRGELSKMPRW